MGKCKTEGCSIKNATFGYVGEKAIACKKHSTPEMKDVVNKNKCICGKSQPHFGLETDNKATCCAKCKTPEMINITDRRKCICGLSRPNFGLETDEKPTCCSKCRSPEMIDMKHKKCICGKFNPSFGLETDKRPTCCSECKTPEMINIASKKCICGKSQPSFGLVNDTTPTCCSKCKTLEMINIVNKKCMCGKVEPSFGLVTDKIPTCCKKCKTPEMINIKSKRCLCGKSQPTFGLVDDKIPTCCLECKTSVMIDLKHQKCICGRVRPIFGLITDSIATCCVNCKTQEMIDIINKRCKIEFCDTIVTTGNKYEGYCTYCFGNLFPDAPIIKNFKTKERLVVDYIRKQYPDLDWKFDKIIEDACSKRRPDIYLDLGYQIIIIEVDENQHRLYDNICENKRLMEISKDVGHRPTIFIRFNPDKYTDINKKTISSCFSIKKTGKLEINNKKQWNERLLKLKDTVDYWLKNTTNKTIELQQLFYDEI